MLHKTNVLVCSERATAHISNHVCTCARTSLHPPAPAQPCIIYGCTSAQEHGCQCIKCAGCRHVATSRHADSNVSSELSMAHREAEPPPPDDTTHSPRSSCQQPAPDACQQIVIPNQSETDETTKRRNGSLHNQTHTHNMCVCRSRTDPIIMPDNVRICHALTGMPQHILLDRC